MTKLETLRNRATLHELAMIRGDEQILIGYVLGKSRAALWKCVTAEKRVNRIVERAGTAAITFGKRVSDGATLGEWTIRFTGRTEREAIAMGELPYIGA